ncbi:MAG TPA: TrmH family RNA methyltransferase [Polyangiaceae bacterium]|nr:TrmH family RNA methyltransferase [Polyangiaceae bacterium]
MTHPILIGKLGLARKPAHCIVYHNVRCYWGGRLEANFCARAGPTPMLEKPLEMTPPAVRETLAPLRNDFSLAVVAPGNAFTIGAVIRVAHNFLAREVFVVGIETYYPKASMGMEKYETIRRLENAAELALACAGRPIWAVEKDHARRSIQSIANFPRDVVFAFGSERFGLPEEILDEADEIVGIPTYGVNHSLPVTVAVGIVVHEWARRHYVEGKTL